VNGHNRERQVRKLLEEEGFVVVRAAGSLGPVDLVALRQGEIRFIECKANKGSPWMNFRRGDREFMREAAGHAGATAELVHWPPRGKPTFIPSSRWPK
jgi:Holliday junction resolvase